MQMEQEGKSLQQELREAEHWEKTQKEMAERIELTKLAMTMESGMQKFMDEMSKFERSMCQEMDSCKLQIQQSLQKEGVMEKVVKKKEIKKKTLKTAPQIDTIVLDQDNEATAQRKGSEDDVEARFVKIEQFLQTKFQALEDQRIKENQTFTRFQQEVKEMVINMLESAKKEICAAVREVSIIKENMNSIVKQIWEMKVEIDSLQKQEKGKEVISPVYEKRLMYLEQDVRRRNVVLKNVPEKNPDQLKLRVLSWLKDLNMGRDFGPSDILAVYRLGIKKGREGCRNILVKFTSLETRQFVMAHIRKIGINALKMGNVNIEAYNDLSIDERIFRRQMKPITKKLRERGTLYNWGFPKQLKFSLHGKSFSINECINALDVLVKAKIIEDGTQEWIDLKNALVFANNNGRADTGNIN